MAITVHTHPRRPYPRTFVRHSGCSKGGDYRTHIHPWIPYPRTFAGHSGESKGWQLPYTSHPWRPYPRTFVRHSGCSKGGDCRTPTHPRRPYLRTFAWHPGDSKGWRLPFTHAPEGTIPPHFRGIQGVRRVVITVHIHPRRPYLHTFAGHSGC